ncbi:7542_t:CDS:2, partial [Dentiscutata erythropus]
NHNDNTVTIIINPEQIKSCVQEHLYQWTEDTIYNPLIATIYEEEIIRVIKLMSNNKASGPSLIPYEVFKHLEENGIKLLCLLYNKIIEIGVVPNDWINSNVTLIPKPKD